MQNENFKKDFNEIRTHLLSDFEILLNKSERLLDNDVFNYVSQRKTKEQFMEYKEDFYPLVKENYQEINFVKNQIISRLESITDDLWSDIYTNFSVKFVRDTEINKSK